MGDVVEKVVVFVVEVMKVDCLKLCVIFYYFVVKEFGKFGDF